MYTKSGQLTARINQTGGTGDPVVLMLENTIDPDIEINRVGDGDYQIVSPTGKLKNATATFQTTNNDITRVNCQNTPAHIDLEVLIGSISGIDLVWTPVDGLTYDATLKIETWEKIEEISITVFPVSPSTDDIVTALEFDVSAKYNGATWEGYDLQAGDKPEIISVESDLPSNPEHGQKATAAGFKGFIEYDATVKKWVKKCGIPPL